MKTLVAIIALFLAVLAGCDPAKSPGENAGHAAYEVEKDAKKAAKEIRKDLKEFSHDAKEGFQDAKKKDLDKKKAHEEGAR
jgi:hypothetical protein